MQERLLNTALIVLTLSSITIVGLAVHREFAPAPSAAILAPESHKDWRTFATGGISEGSSVAPVTLTVFSDYQCPYCRSFAGTLAEFKKKHKVSLRVVYHNFPLEGIHPFAHEAALAAECANAEGKFWSMNNVLFNNQDKIGSSTWGWFGAQAGIADTIRLNECVKNEELATRVSADVQLGKRVPVTGTPTVFVNEWKLPGTPNLAALDSIYAAELAHQ